MTAQGGSPHTFHIPVMGTGFTIDTPLRIARYGISSVISLVDDVLIEQMRHHHCLESGIPYEAIADGEHDSRARRITAYLNMLHDLIVRQMDVLRRSPFEQGSDITRYYELLPDCPEKRKYEEMLACDDPVRRRALEDELRGAATPGTIDVNIMTKLDRALYVNGKRLAQEFSDGMSAFRGYANSVLCSSIIFSAGLNPHLYGYATQFADFYADEAGVIRKKVVLKVSDFRSALIQGRFFAKHGIWVSEYRVESGLNCGGHAFATRGELSGPILEEFMVRREELVSAVHGVYCKAVSAHGRPAPEAPLGMRVTYQGGVATGEEHASLLNLYGLDGVGWGTPFLLVPEVTSVDDDHIALMAEAGEEDVYLGDGSPLGIPFWTLRSSASETARCRRIDEGVPGSACPKGFLQLDDEFGELSMCRASRGYQALKLRTLAREGNLTADQRAELEREVVARACICHDLAGGASIKYGFDTAATPAVCPSKSIVHFTRTMSLDELVGHIYGRMKLIADAERPHVFVREMGLYVDYLKAQLHRLAFDATAAKPGTLAQFRDHLLEGVEYYRQRAVELVQSSQRAGFLDALENLANELLAVELPA